MEAIVSCQPQFPHESQVTMFSRAVKTRGPFASRRVHSSTGALSCGTSNVMTE